MERTDIINYFIKKYNYKNYLEIGVCHPSFNYNKINCINKECIDPAPLDITGITYLMTSDEAFNKIKSENKKYDIVFIDGLHLEAQVDKDVQNSLDCLTPNGTIVLHDCNPPTPIHGGRSHDMTIKYTNGEWNGTVYKSIIKFNKNNMCCSVLETDWGCGIIRPLLQNKPIIMDFEPLLIDWDYFDDNRVKLLNLKKPHELYNM